MRKSEPVLVWMSILAGLQTFFAGSTATTVFVDANETLTAAFAFSSLAVGAAQFGIQFYVRGQVVPVEDVMEMRVAGRVVAGQANDVVRPGSTVREVGEAPRVQEEVQERIKVAEATASAAVAEVRTLREAQPEEFNPSPPDDHDAGFPPMDSRPDQG